VQVGDLVKVNTQCTASALWDLYGIVTGLKSIANADCADVWIPGLPRLPLISLSALDLIQIAKRKKKEERI
jgi:hypothetical protein